MKKQTWILGAAAVITAIGLTGCAPSEPEATTPPATSKPSASAEAPSETPEPIESETPTAAALTQDELDAVFTGLQFQPGAFADTTEMVASIYPGLSAMDPACLLPFGVRAEADPAVTGATVSFGPTTDRSMTAFAVSAEDPLQAESFVTAVDEAITTCASTADAYTLDGQPVAIALESFDPGLDGATQQTGWRAMTSIAGTDVTLVGITAQIDGNVIAVVGWNPETNEQYVPAASQMFVDELGAQ